MSAHVCEEILALYVRGDLPEDEWQRVAQHSDECQECQKILADLSLSCELLTNSLKEPTLAELAALRSAVMGKIPVGATDSRGWVRMFAAAAGIVLLCLATLIWRGEREELLPVARLPRPGPPAVMPPPEPPIVAPRTHVARVPRQRIEPGMRATLITRAGQPDYLKMNTSDPNVVILWQVQENEKVATP